MRDHGHPLLELTKARILEFVRDPGAVFWTFGFPIVLAVALGVAFRESPEPRISVAVDRTAARAGEVMEALASDDSIDAELVDPDAIAPSLASGKVDVLVIPDDDGGRVFRYDKARPESRAARLAADAAIARANGSLDAESSTDEPLTGVGARYIDFLVPGLIGLNIMGSAIWGIGFGVVDARKRKLLKRLAATPMRRAYFLLAYMLSRLVFLVAEVVALVGFGWLVFDVDVHGSWFALGFISVFGALTMTGVAMLIAARPTSTEVASGWSNLFMLPMWLLSGAFFSYERFPEYTHPFIKALPLTAINDALRAVINRGGSLGDVVAELAVLAAWGAICFVIALKIFRWQ